MAAALHGVALVEAVIATIERGGFAEFAGRGQRPTPVPLAALAALRFPNGKPLSPSLARWLAYDASWLGWFADPARPKFRPTTLGAYTTAEYEWDWGFGKLGFDDEVYDVVGAGSESRRLLYVGEPDSTGEYPVLVTDTDNPPGYLGVEYPGIDVYLAMMTDVVTYKSTTYGALIKHRVYGTRMQEHADRYFGGASGKAITELVDDPRVLLGPTKRR